MTSPSDGLIGTGRLTGLGLRRDRLMTPLWVLGIVVIAVSTTTSYRGLYPTLASRLVYAHTVETSGGLLALTGKPFDLTSLGGLIAWRTTSFNALLTGIMSYLLVVRHTRAEEESHRLELLGSAVVGRFAPLTAGVLTALTANLALATLLAVGSIGLGLPAAGSLALGLACAVTGVIFTALAAISAQLTESARAANGLAAALIAVAYLLRAVGDATSAGWLSWLSPIGWAEQLRPFAGERWWLLFPVAVLTLALLAVAYLLEGRRDLGAGLLPSRPGPAHAPGWLRSAFALAWRLQRGLLLAWMVGFAVVGGILGGLASTVSGLVRSSPQLGDLLKSSSGQGLVDSYFAATMTVAGVVAAGYVVQAVSRLAGEESAQRAEPLLATPTGRVRWALGHLAIALFGSVLLLGGLGLSAGLVYGVRSGQLGDQLPRVLGAALIQLFAVWVFAALVIALFGLAPRFTPVAWGVVLIALALNLLGPLLTLNHWLVDVSPFSQVPALPGGHPTWTPLIGLTVAILALGTAGLAGLHRRDLR